MSPLLTALPIFAISYLPMPDYRLLEHLQPKDTILAFDHDSDIARLMTQGGDARIVLDPQSRLNRYSSGPYPRDVLALASSTANDLSADAAAYLGEKYGFDAGRLNAGDVYADALEESRTQIRNAYNLASDIDIFFAPSGTDLEYVPLFASAGKSTNGVSNLLLGADEVGSGCIHSAAGRYFANETALGTSVAPGIPVAGMVPVEMGDFPVRDAMGTAFDGPAIAAQMGPKIADALAAGLHPLVHVVHGSKTGLVLPHLDEIDALIERFGDGVSFVVDACQARITTPAIHDYLKRGIVVFLTGSKFMGGPPFSGFALLPPGMASSAAPLPVGASQIFRRAEVPADWAGRETLDDSGNAGLALRLSASLFELERFQKLSIEEVARVVGSFTVATDTLAAMLDVRKVGAAAPSEAGEPAGHPIEMQTLVTLDLCHDQNGNQARTIDFDGATAIHKALIGQGIRLGQPVKCVKLADGRWGATVRIGISMPQLVKLSVHNDAEIAVTLDAMMDRIAQSLAELLNSGD
jgi:hypothetical protein